MAYKLHPLNDLVFVVTLKEVTSAGQVANAVDGVVTVFLATTNLPTAIAADPSLTGTATYTGTGGRWLVQFEAAVLDPALLATLFGAGGTPYVILQRVGSARVFIELEYEAAKPALNG